MSIVHITEATGGLPNSGRLSGTNGDLVGILDVGLLLNGWAIEYTSGNARVYRAGSGNRFRLFVGDDSSISGAANFATIRGAENASAASVASLVDPFPTVAQMSDANSNWIKSNVVSTAARNFDLWVSPTYLILAVNLTGVTNVWEIHFWGDVPPNLLADSYNTVCFVRTSLAAGGVFFATGANTFAGNNHWYWARSYDGTVKSTTGAPQCPMSTGFGSLGSAAAAFLGPDAGLDTAKVSFTDSGSTTTTPSSTTGLPMRGWLPQILTPLHAGRQATTPNSRDTYADTGYNASFVGTVFTASNGSAANFVVVEGDTWSPPSG